jgi:oligopeptide/dipeptide ABC transporter ATP-binding protein
MSEFLLEVNNLKIHFPVYGGVLKRKIGNIFAVDGVSFAIGAGETVGLVGESGCGKTTVGRGVIALYRPTDGEVIFKGKKVSDLSKKEIRPIRKTMQMIFQDPFESLNSRHTIGEILEEPFVIHGIGTASERKQRVNDLLLRVGMQEKSVNLFPHEFSGGQRQRIGIARAIALNPELIVCDEPVSALDVSIQSQILNLLVELQEEMNLSYLFIAHDLAVVKHVSDRIAVMYLGKIVEYAHADKIYENPLHPYTRALMSAIPIPDPKARRKKIVLTGDVPSPRNPPPGCRFHTRCPMTIGRCRFEEPELLSMEDDSHWAACHRAWETSR